MKKIKIYLKNQDPLEFFDNDDSDLEEYQKKIINAFKSEEIITFGVTEKMVTLRPSYIIGIETLNILEFKKENDEGYLENES